MRFTRLFTLAVLAVMILAFMPRANESKKSSAEKDTNGINWYGYQEGWEKAKAEKNPLVELGLEKDISTIYLLQKEQLDFILRKVPQVVTTTNFSLREKILL